MFSEVVEGRAGVHLPAGFELTLMTSATCRGQLSAALIRCGSAARVM